MTELQVAIVAGAAIVLVWVLFANFRDQRGANKAVENTAPTLVEEPVLRVASERTQEGEIPSEFSESIARLTWQEPIVTSRIEAELRGVRRVGSKPLLFGWIASPGEEPQPQPTAERISALQIGVLLATRSGPLHAMEYTEWQALATRLATSLGAQLVLPEMSEVLSRARALDQLCASVDAQLSLAIRAEQVLSVDAIAHAARLAGLEQRGESRFAMGGLTQQRFSVFPGDTGDTLVLLLDVPRTTEPRLAFEEMVRVGQSMALALSARLSDDSGRSLSPKDFELIADQVAAKAQQLRQSGIEPGSAMALRLFL